MASRKKVAGKICHIQSEQNTFSMSGLLVVYDIFWKVVRFARDTDIARTTSFAPILLGKQIRRPNACGATRAHVFLTLCAL